MDNSYDVIVLNTTVDYNNYDIISLTNIKCAADMTLSKPSQLTRMGYNLAGRNVLTGNDEAVLSAKSGVTNVTRGKYASMTVVTKKEANRCTGYRSYRSSCNILYEKDKFY